MYVTSLTQLQPNKVSLFFFFFCDMDMSILEPKVVWVNFTIVTTLTNQEWACWAVHTPITWKWTTRNLSIKHFENLTPPLQCSKQEVAADS